MYQSGAQVENLDSSHGFEVIRIQAIFKSITEVDKTDQEKYIETRED